VSRALNLECWNPAEFHSRSSSRSAVDPTVVALDEYSTRELRSRYRRRASLVCGVFSVPFTVLTNVLPPRWDAARPIFGVMAVLFFSIAAYSVWATERQRLVVLESHLAPRLRFEFDPNQPKFVSVTPTQGGFDMLYVRVLARALSPTVNNCRGYLQRVSQLDGER
jgi:hypothetical protein